MIVVTVLIISCQVSRLSQRIVGAQTTMMKRRRRRKAPGSRGERSAPLRHRRNRGHSPREPPVDSTDTGLRCRLDSLASRAAKPVGRTARQYRKP